MVNSTNYDRSNEDDKDSEDVSNIFSVPDCSVSIETVQIHMCVCVCVRVLFYCFMRLLLNNCRDSKS